MQLYIALGVLALSVLYAGYRIWRTFHVTSPCGGCEGCPLADKCEKQDSCCQKE